MTTLSADNLAVLVLQAGAWLAAGVLLGGFHFLTLRWNVRMFASDPSPLLPLGIQVLRFALVAAVLATVAHYFGALALLIVTAGVLVARTAVIRLGAQP
jgi:F1F0 ATPase subunit 2